MATAASGAVRPPGADLVPPSTGPTSGRIDGVADDSLFSGVLLVQDHGRLIHEQAYGSANLEFSAPNRLDTRYWVASITKAFTAVLVLRLVDEGRVDLDAAIGTYLDGYAGEAARRVTIHQLLNHTSGQENIDRIPNIEDVREGIRAATDEARSRGVLPLYQTPYDSDQLVELFCSRPLVHTPGATFDYNNADYILLGKLVERLHRKPFDEVLRRTLLSPLGLTGSGMLRHQDVVPRLASTYSPDAGTMIHDTPVYPENWYAAGAMYATAGDVLKFSGALFGGKLLKPATMERMIAPGLDDYGYGVWSRRLRAGGASWRVVTRPGRIMGARAQLLHMPELQITIVALANTGEADLDRLSLAIAQEMAAARPPQPGR